MCLEMYKKFVQSLSIGVTLRRHVKINNYYTLIQIMEEYKGFNGLKPGKKIFGLQSKFSIREKGPRENSRDSFR